MSIAANSIFGWRKEVAGRAHRAVRVPKAVAVHGLVASRHGVPDHGAKEKNEHADVGSRSTSRAAHVYSSWSLGRTPLVKLPKPNGVGW